MDRSPLEPLCEQPLLDHELPHFGLADGAVAVAVDKGEALLRDDARGEARTEPRLDGGAQPGEIDAPGGRLGVGVGVGRRLVGAGGRRDGGEETARHRRGRRRARATRAQ